MRYLDHRWPAGDLCIDAMIAKGLTYFSGGQDTAEMQKMVGPAGLEPATNPL